MITLRLTRQFAHIPRNAEQGVRHSDPQTRLSTLAVLHSQGLRLSKKRVGVRDDKVGMRPLAGTDFVVDRTSIKAVGACPGGRQSHVDAIKAGLFLGNVV